MENWQLMLVWAFGVGCAVIMLGSLVKRRRDSLVKSLRDHVEGEIGKTIEEPPEEVKEIESEEPPNDE